MHTQIRYTTCPQGMSKKKRGKTPTQRRYATCHKACQKKGRKRKYSPYQKYYKEERNHIKEFHPPSTKNIHTLAHLDQGLWLVSPLDPVFDLAKCEKRVAFTSSIPTDPPKRAIRSRMKKQRHIKRPWWGMKHIWPIREITRGTTIFLFKNFIKTSGLTVEQRSGKWYSTSRSDPQPPKMRMML